MQRSGFTVYTRLFFAVTGLKIGTDIKTIKIPFDPAKINATEEELIKQFASNATQAVCAVI